MKKGDLVKNGSSDNTGIVVGIGYMATCPSYDKVSLLKPRHSRRHFIRQTLVELQSTGGYQ